MPMFFFLIRLDLDKVSLTYDVCSSLLDLSFYIFWVLLTVSRCIQQDPSILYLGRKPHLLFLLILQCIFLKVNVLHISFL